jgi:SRSO17 transposase
MPWRFVRLRPQLVQSLGEFAESFGRKNARQHLANYVLGKCRRWSAKPIAMSAGVRLRTPATVSLFPGLGPRAIDRRLQWRVAPARTPSRRSIRLLDETSCPKKGGQDTRRAAAKVWRLGQTGQRVTTVHRGYAAAYHCLLASESYLPESWAADRRIAGRQGFLAGRLLYASAAGPLIA